MSSSNRGDLIKALLALPPACPLDTAKLREHGVSPTLASKYVRAGWLKRLGRGFFALRENELKVSQTLALLAQRANGEIHIGGRTALAWHGIQHNVPTRERYVIWGRRANALPLWFTQRFPTYFCERRLFDDGLPSAFAISVLPETPDGAPVSEPERALLEMLDEVGKTQGVEEARNIFENLYSLRPKILTELLAHCTRIKVVRLCVNWAQEFNFAWASKIGIPDRGSARWVKKLSDGTTLSIKP
ncbi:MAG: type IV toxin-antitoxin system AbiEi family antitoxin [Puniceicoccales bacterium]|jgi:hypothetical protein|nr:type IV toxin-antitoxin system AbiEi family antitoxin [Puniceicoccales bacterium]